MMPRLYEAGTLEFRNNGLGSLADAVSCRVRQGFGTSELEMQYPTTGRLSRQLLHKRIILAEPEPLADPQPYSIYRVTKPMGGAVKVYARHVCYDLDGYPVRPFWARTAQEAMRGLKDNAMELHPFRFETDVGRNGTFAIQAPMSTWKVLGGTEGSILDVFHGEYEFDGYTVRLKTRRGADRGVSIRYGKNLQTLEQDENCAGCYTGVVPYWVNPETGVAVYTEPVYASGNFGYTKLLPLDLTSEFTGTPTQEALRVRARLYAQENDIGVPSVSLKVKFVPLEQTAELKHLALLERVQMGDTVHVYFPEMDIDVNARVVETDYDTMRGRYNEVTIGRVKQTLPELIVKQQEAVEKIPDGDFLTAAMSAATAAILGAKGGSVRHLDTDGDGRPDTLYIADSEYPDQAKKVWRFNYEGWAASENGYNGPFVMAASIEHGMVANFITAGELNADLIKMGTLDGEKAKITNIDAEEIKTGKLAAARIDVDNLIAKRLEAREEAEDGFTGILKTEFGRIKFEGDDGSMSRQVLEIGVERQPENLASCWPVFRLRSYLQGVESCLAQLFADRFSLSSRTEVFGRRGVFSAEVDPVTGLVWLIFDNLDPTGNGNCVWEYNAVLGKTILVQKTETVQNYAILYNLVGATASPYNETMVQSGTVVELYFDLQEGYSWPETIEVWGANVMWLPGYPGEKMATARITAATSDITINITAVPAVSETVYAISWNLTGVRPGINPTEITEGGSAQLQFQLQSGYSWPESISVSGAEYSWQKDSPSAGYCQVNLWSAVGDVSITITAVADSAPEVYSITARSVGVKPVIGNPTEITEGGSAQLQFQLQSGYSWPESISVSGASYSWQKDSPSAGYCRVSLSGATGPVSIVITAEKT